MQLPRYRTHQHEEIQIWGIKPSVSEIKNTTECLVSNLGDKNPWNNPIRQEFKKKQFKRIKENLCEIRVSLNDQIFIWRRSKGKRGHFRTYWIKGLEKDMDIQLKTALLNALVIPLLGINPKEVQSAYKKATRSPLVTCSNTSHNNKNMKTTQMPIERGMDKEMVHLLYGIDYTVN